MLLNITQGEGGRAAHSSEIGWQHTGQSRVLLLNVTQGEKERAAHSNETGCQHTGQSRVLLNITQGEEGRAAHSNETGCQHTGQSMVLLNVSQGCYLTLHRERKGEQFIAVRQAANTQDTHSLTHSSFC